MSQGDVEKKTGLLRCYISRVENGHTVPAVQTLEKLARAFEIPMYKLFYEGKEPPKAPNIFVRKSSHESGWGSTGKDAKYFSQLRRLLSRSSENDRKLILYTAQKMARE
jgi:transcriptional regulator with XRE-family HTH domain